MTIYTKKGDAGETTIFQKGRGKIIMISKASALIDVIGALDEANSYIGVIASYLKSSDQKIKNKVYLSRIFHIQRNLFAISSALAGAKISLKSLEVKMFEKEMDRMDKDLPVLSNFILPGGSPVGAQLMYARTLVRKAERKIVLLTQKSKIESQKIILIYMNRLSDYLFVLARRVNIESKVKEIKWKT